MARSEDPVISRSSKSWTVGELLKWTEQRFTELALPTARLDAELLLAHAMGVTRLELYTGFDRPVDLLPDRPGSFASVAGRMPEAPISEGEIAQMAIGQGQLLLSPLHLASLLSVIGVDGSRVPLSIVEPWGDPSVVSRTAVFPPEVVREVREMMERVVERGTGRSARLSVCGRRNSGFFHVGYAPVFSSSPFISLFFTSLRSSDWLSC